MRPLLCVLLALGPLLSACGGGSEKNGGAPIDGSVEHDADGGPLTCKPTESPCGGACVGKTPGT